MLTTHMIALFGGRAPNAANSPASDVPDGPASPRIDQPALLRAIERTVRGHPAYATCATLASSVDPLAHGLFGARARSRPAPLASPADCVIDPTLRRLLEDYQALWRLQGDDARAYVMARPNLRRFVHRMAAERPLADHAEARACPAPGALAFA